MRWMLLGGLAVSALGIAACREDAAGPPSAGQTSARPPATKMRALKVNDPAVAAETPESSVPDGAPVVNGNKRATVTDGAAIVQSGPAAGSRQSLTVRSSTVRGEQRQDGHGNNQILNVEGTTGAGISQRQGGAGNFQSMNIGVTDNPSATSASSAAR